MGTKRMFFKVLGIFVKPREGLGEGLVTSYLKNLLEINKI